MKEKNRVELKGVKYAAFASQETSCFTATVYIDGKKEGSVENDGHGGCNLYHPHTLLDKINAIAVTLPDVEGFGSTFKQDADILVGDLLNAVLEERQMKRLTKRQGVYVDSGRATERRSKFL